MAIKKFPICPYCGKRISLKYFADHIKTHTTEYKRIDEKYPVRRVDGSNTKVQSAGRSS